MRVAVGSSDKCAWTLKMRVMRKSYYYETNVMLIVGSITTITMLASLFPYYDWENRSNFITTLLLTAVTFKSITARELPKVSFFTILDIYMLFTLTIMLVLMMQSAWMRFMYLVDMVNDDDGMFVDLMFTCVMMVVWVFGNAFFFYRYNRLKERFAVEVGPFMKEVPTNFDSEGALQLLMQGRK